VSGRHSFLFLLSRLQVELNRLFADFEDLGETVDDEAGWTPTVDVIESDSTLVLIAALPGLSAEDVLLEVSGDVVTLAGRRDLEVERRPRTRVLQAARQPGEFRRRIQLPRAVNGSQAMAFLVDGVLEVTFPKIVDQRQQRWVIDIEETER